jgi:hypothetical protein
MAPGDLLRIKEAMPFALADAAAVMRELRFVKSEAEIAHIRHICGIECQTDSDCQNQFIPTGNCVRR